MLSSSQHLLLVFNAIKIHSVTLEHEHPFIVRVAETFLSNTCTLPKSHCLLRLVQLHQEGVGYLEVKLHLKELFKLQISKSSVSSRDEHMHSQSKDKYQSMTVIKQKYFAM